MRLHVTLDETSVSHLRTLQQSGKRSMSNAVRAALARAATIERNAAGGFSEVKLFNPETGKSKTVEVVGL